MTRTTAEWSIQQIARAAGTTSRTLRHYDDVGLLAPSRVGPNGYRYYDEDALLRLQRILLLRGLGLGLPAIAEVLDGPHDPAAALRTHLDLLEEERDRLHRRIASARATLRKLERGEPLMAKEMFDGFDPARYEDEVVERWGREAYDRGASWWRSLSQEEKERFGGEQLALGREFAAAREAGEDPAGERAQALARRQYDWVVAGWQGRRPDAEAFAGLGETYVADPRFTAAYDVHGEGTARYVRDAMKAYADRELA